MPEPPPPIESCGTLADFRWLVGQEGAIRLALLQKESDAQAGGELLNRLVSRLRTDLSPARVHLLLEQLELRRRAEDKFRHADKMFFTRRALEQATDQWVAEYKARRFLIGRPIADLCCGIGGDLLGLMRCGPVLGVDRDSITALLAEANLRSATGSGAGEYDARIAVADVTSVEVNEAAAWHIDPDRRPVGRRTTRVALHEPGPEVLRRLLSACPDAAIKLAPAATLDEPWWQPAELEWIGRGRQCRQLVAWFGRLAEHPERRRATVLPAANLSGAADSTTAVTATFMGEANADCPIAARIGRYVFEPDAAVLAAKLEGALAVSQSLSAVAAGVAYYTADHCATHGALAGFEVLEVLPYKVRPLRQWLAARGIGRLEIKKRGVSLDPEQVRRDLQTDGSDEATILLARIDGRIMAVIARRCAE